MTRCLISLLLGLALAVPGRADDAAELAPLVQVLAEVDEPAVQADLLTGLREGLKGRRNVGMPKGWPATYAKLAASPNAQVKELALELALTFGDPQALIELRKVVVDKAAAAERRQAAVAALTEQRADGLAPLLHDLLDDSVVRLTAIRGLAAVARPDSAGHLLARFAKLTPEEKAAAVATLAARPESARQLLDAVERRQVARSDVSAFVARQIAALGDADLTARLRQVWGEVRDTPQQKQEQIARLKAALEPDVLKKANLGNGRRLYAQTCRQCHTLYGDGGKIGPELTGSNRANLDYLLSNIVDPSAEIGRDYRLSILALGDGRVLTGIVVERTPQQLTLQTATERLVLPTADIDAMRESPLSMMPEGQLDRLTLEQIRDLVAYLATKSQVALPE